MNILPNCYRCGCQPRECRDGITLYHADCLDVLPLLEPVGACVCDPPYGIGFMGKEFDTFTPGYRADNWDGYADQPKTSPGMHAGKYDRSTSANQTFQAWCKDWAVALLSALLPGAPLLVFGGTRTWHRLACGIEDAGFELRDTLCWLYGSGFPKSLDVSKAIDKKAFTDWLAIHPAEVKRLNAIKDDDERDEYLDELRKAAGAEREVVGEDERFQNQTVAIGGKAAYGGVTDNRREFTAPATEAAQLWDGWGTALKPAWEPILLAMKPLDGTFAANALEHGVAGLNVDGARIPTSEAIQSHGARGGFTTDSYQPGDYGPGNTQTAGRFPANLLLSHHHECVQVRVPCADCNGTGYASGVVEPLPDWATDEATLDDPKVSERRREWHNSLERCATCKGSGKQVGVKKVKKGGGRATTRHVAGSLSQGGGNDTTWEDYADANGLETVEDWQCHPDCPVGMLPERQVNKPGRLVQSSGYGGGWGDRVPFGYSDFGSAARFFYCAKASGADRGNLPAEELPLFGESIPEFVNTHPTVKPLALMRYLLTLVAMPTDVGVVDPFAGSGTTGVAAKQMGRRCVLIESEEAYCEIAATRLRQGVMFSR